MVYAVVVVVQNLKVFQITNTHTAVSTFLIFGSILSFYIWWLAESELVIFPNVYRLWDETLSSKNSWWILLLGTWINYAQFICYSDVQRFRKLLNFNKEAQL